MKLVSTVLMTVLLSAVSVSRDDQYKRARSLYYQGSDGNKEACEQSARLFDVLHQQEPENPLIEVYTGSLRLWEASHTWALWKKNALSKEGVKLMDSAVQSEPQNLEIRFVRAVTDYNLPLFFHRRKQSVEEFGLLAKQAPGHLEPRLAAASLYYHGLLLREASDGEGAEAAFKRAVTVAPQSRAARDSAEELRKLSH